ncbi:MULTISPECIES: DnaJ domain-containing protein [Treponema]|jgi:hypothetical protein|uniref:DnaJ domain-containing protein n=1 Tax=Treponema TaxID=157 RepID=UPI0002B5DB38|nr:MULTISPECIES: DnaJ domain-containing protein [Treponema]EMB45330.1 hypothetical protein HMPREF9729_01548 [Treponema denticola ASLM]EMB45878.1 hypothetical protein HMPREF9730_01004 [Treponema denticola AL-2]EMD57237.1 hypothetical protein HMPREF9728_00731 [Treponema denticola US-Trep]UTD10741.1 DnaJ domain-containing protein [Treponema sp. B152]
MHLDFWNNKKRAEEFARNEYEKSQKENRIKREQEKRIKKTERNLDKSAAINKQSIDVLQQSLESEQELQQKIDTFNKQVAEFQKKLDENQRLQEQLQIKQTQLSSWEEDLKNRAEANRKEEMSIHIRSESVKKDEQRVAKKDTDLESERQNIKDERISMKERVAKAEKAEKEYTEKKDEYIERQKSADEQKREFEDKLKDLDSREEKCKSLEEDISRRLFDVETKERNFSSTEKTILKAFEVEKEHWETERAEIENNLNEKIKEYDRRLADMEAMTETMDNIAFDDSEDGKKAKIVVKETIRMAMKTLEENLQKFKELDEKYASGTFKGFSIPIDEISSVNEELKSQYEAVKEHTESTGLDFSVWLEKIETCILEADKNFKSFFFAECYRNTVEGLSYCKGYSDIINILNEYADSSESSEENASDESDSEWEDYYEFLFENDYDCSFDYTQLNENDLKKQYRKMAKKYHPDAASDEDLAEYTEITTHLNRIWEELSDSGRRTEYDSTYLENRNSHQAA